MKNSTSTMFFLAGAMTAPFIILPTITYAENLIFNGNFERGAFGFSTDYTPDTPGVGGSWPSEYHIIANTVEEQIIYAAYMADHTSGSGLMMYVDSATSPDQIVWSKHVSVSQNTTYALSAWLGIPSGFADELPPSDPGGAVVEFFVNGVSLGIYDSRNVNVWQQFSGSWNSGSSVSADITIISQNLIFAGNDFVLDDIVFEPTYLGGAASRSDINQIGCINITTGLSIRFDPGEGMSWDCEAEGLVVNPGDEIKMIIRGQAK